MKTWAAYNCIVTFASSLEAKIYIQCLLRENVLQNFKKSNIRFGLYESLISHLTVQLKLKKQYLPITTGNQTIQKNLIKH